MGKALAIALWTLAAGVVVLFLAHSIWGVSATWWLPAVISANGHDYDSEFNRTLVVAGIAFMLAQLGLGFVVFRYRAQKGKFACYIQGSNLLEILWTSITLIVFITLGVMGERLWVKHNQNQPPRVSADDPTAKTLDVEVVAEQFAWNFRYPGPDAQFGRTDPKLIDDPGGNPLGIDYGDPNSRDDVVSSTLALQVNRPVHLIFRSKDVIHSFFVPGLRFKQDLVPGMEINGYFTPTVTGEYEIACAELCGLGHYKMKSYMDVMSEVDFSTWLAQKSRRITPAPK